MKSFGISLIACAGLLFSVQAVGSGLSNALKRQMLSSKQFIEKISSVNHVLPTAINSRNLYEHVKTASEKISGTLSTLIVAGALSVVLAIPSQGAPTLDAAKIDKMGKAAVAEETTQGEYWHKFGISGSLLSSTNKLDSFIYGASFANGYRYGLTSVSVNAAAIANNTKATDADWETTSDLKSRGKITQGFDINSQYVTPILQLDSGAAQYGETKRLFDITANAGVELNNTIYGKDIFVELRGGAGFLGNGMYMADSNSYADAEWDSVIVIGLSANLPWVTLGEITNAEESSILHKLPILPGGTLEYSSFFNTDDFDDVTSRISGSLALTKELSVKGEWSKRSNEESHHTIMASLELSDLLSR